MNLPTPIEVAMTLPNREENEVRRMRREWETKTSQRLGLRIRDRSKPTAFGAQRWPYINDAAVHCQNNVQESAHSGSRLPNAQPNAHRTRRISSHEVDRTRGGTAPGNSYR